MSKSSYEFGIVMFTLGNIFSELDRDSEFVNMDLGELTEIGESVYSDWLNMVDIRNQEEEGYIGVYAYRRLREKFGISTLNVRFRNINTF